MSSNSPCETMTDGERWAREVLGSLRAAHFTPRAWATFLWASFVRANDRRALHPTAFRQLLALTASGCVAWALVAWLSSPTLALAGGLFWLTIMLMLDWHLGMLDRPNGTPIAGLGVANMLDICRLGAVPAFAVLSPGWLVVALLLIGTLDVLDGRIARARNEVTRLGHWLDGSVDTVVLVSGAWFLVRADELPLWAAVLVAVRYVTPLVVVTGWYFLAAAPPPQHGYVPGRYPGVVLLAGLLLAPFWAAGAIVLVALGALGGVLTFAATMVRSAQPQPAAGQPAR